MPPSSQFVANQKLFRTELLFSETEDPFFIRGDFFVPLSGNERVEHQNWIFSPCSSRIDFVKIYFCVAKLRRYDVLNLENQEDDSTQLKKFDGKPTNEKYKKV